VALLPRLAPSLWVFAVAGGLLSAVIAGSWSILSMTAGTWPRPRTGWVLIVIGAIFGVVFAWQHRWFNALWNLALVLTGLGFIVPVGNRRRSDTADREGGVRPPIGRREGI
jgi:Kef-type K+ transport system membrane component KefB